MVLPSAATRAPPRRSDAVPVSTCFTGTSAAERGHSNGENRGRAGAHGKGVGLRFDEAGRAGHAGHAGVHHRLPCRRLVAHDADVVGVRADEVEAVLAADADKVGVLREEAVAGVHRARAVAHGGGEQVARFEVALQAALLCLVTITEGYEAAARWHCRPCCRVPCNEGI